MDIKFSCLECRQHVKTSVEELCHGCFFSRFKDLPQYSKKKLFWRAVKDWSYFLILYYIPIIVIIHIYGIKAEYLWVFGGIHAILVQPIKAWLMRIF